MKSEKNRAVPLALLIGTMLSISILHACKKTGCWHCTAYDDTGQRITKQKLCSDTEELAFRATYWDADEIKCDN